MKTPRKGESPVGGLGTSAHVPQLPGAQSERRESVSFHDRHEDTTSCKYGRNLFDRQQSDVSYLHAKLFEARLIAVGVTRPIVVPTPSDIRNR